MAQDMDIYSRLRGVLCERLVGLEVLAGLDLSAVVLTPPREAAHGDMATNAALVLAKPSGKNPRELAEMIAASLADVAEIERVEIAGPGFINLSLPPLLWQKELAVLLAAGDRYGASDMGAGERVNIEYVSANPTGPLHIGHARGAVFGDALARLMAYAGYDVTREYYVNDEGAQIEALAQSVFLRAREAMGEEIEIPKNLYPGDYLIPIGKRLAKEHGAALLDMDEAKRRDLLSKQAVAAMMEGIKEDLSALDVSHDVFTYESALYCSGAVEAAVDFLQKKNLVFEGALAPPKGKKSDDWEARVQTLFRASDYGDDSDRALRKEDGSWTYFASDMAYHYDKYRRGFKRMINVFGADHGGYVKRLRAAVRALSDDEAQLDVLLIHLVRFVEDGVSAQMSKRAGSFLTLRALIDEIGCDAARFIMLTRKSDAPLDIDLQLLKEQSNDNPVFYVQYAHARCCSVLRKAGLAPDVPDEPDPAILDKALFLKDEAEFALMRLLCELPREIKAAARAAEPHRIAFYLRAVAGAFHALWNKGKEDPALRFIAGDEAQQKGPSDDNIGQARLCLIRATQQILATGLHLMGVRPVKEM